jgi:hypothetical protein
MKHGWNTDFWKPVRAGIIVATPSANGQSSVRSDIMVAVRKDRKMPPRRGWELFWFWFYKYAAPDGAGNRQSQMQFGVDERGKGRLNVLNYGKGKYANFY